MRQRCETSTQPESSTATLSQVRTFAHVRASRTNALLCNAALPAENILLHDKNDPTNIVLTDFGLAKCRELVDLHDRKVVGTQSYIAPELYKGGCAGQAP